MRVRPLTILLGWRDLRSRKDLLLKVKDGGPIQFDLDCRDALGMAEADRGHFQNKE